MLKSDTQCGEKPVCAPGRTAGDLRLDECERRGVELKLRGCRKVQRWLLSGLQTDGGFSDAAICAGLDVAANLKIAATSGGRANRPYQKLSTGHPLAGTSCVLRTGPLRSIASSVHLPEKSQAYTSTTHTPAHHTPTRHRYKPNTELKNFANFASDKNLLRAYFQTRTNLSCTFIRNML